MSSNVDPNQEKMAWLTPNEMSALIYAASVHMSLIRESGEEPRIGALVDSAVKKLRARRNELMGVENDRDEEE